MAETVDTLAPPAQARRRRTGDVVDVEVAVIVAVLLVLAVYAAVVAVAVPVLKRLGFAPERGSDNRVTVGAMLAALVVQVAIAGGVAAAHLLLGGDVGELGLRFHTTDAVAVGAVAVVTFAGALATARTTGPLAVAARRPDAAPVVAAGLLALLAAAFMEELLFRAYLLVHLRPLGIPGAVAASTALFALVHLPTNPRSPSRIAGWVVSGLAFAVAFLVSGSVVVPALLHFVHNASNVLVLDPVPGLGLVRPERPVAAPVRAGWYAVLAAATVAVTSAVY